MGANSSVENYKRFPRYPRFEWIQVGWARHLKNGALWTIEYNPGRSVYRGLAPNGIYYQIAHKRGRWYLLQGDLIYTWPQSEPLYLIRIAKSWPHMVNGIPSLWVQ